MKRPCLDLEKMMKVIITDYFYLFIKILMKLYQFTFKSIFSCRSCWMRKNKKPKWKVRLLVIKAQSEYSQSEGKVCVL